MRRRHPSCPSILHRPPAFPRRARDDVKGHALSQQREERGYTATSRRLKKHQHGKETVATIQFAKKKKGGDSLLAFITKFFFPKAFPPPGLTNAFFMSSSLSSLPNPLSSPPSTRACQACAAHRLVCGAQGEAFCAAGETAEMLLGLHFHACIFSCQVFYQPQASGFQLPPPPPRQACCVYCMLLWNAAGC